MNSRDGMRPRVVVHVVTYRRPQLLKRALASVAAQTYESWECRVINDDPDDDEVERIIDGAGDSRIRLFQPVRRRGATGSFNEAFKAGDGAYTTLLEDDNWWEPQFLETMVAALEAQPEVMAACGNERIWKENGDGSWTDTGRVLWPKGEDVLFSTSPVFACGSAKICNSSMLARILPLPAQHGLPWLVPDDIPVDVTEHFRERALPQPVLLLNEPLVNYAETLKTHRDVTGERWGDYQILLIGSVFASLETGGRRELAKALHAPMQGRPGPRATTLLATGLAIPEARELWRAASWRQKARFLVTAGRRHVRMLRVFSVQRRLAEHWKWLLESRFNRSLDEK